MSAQTAPTRSHSSIAEDKLAGISSNKPTVDATHAADRAKIQPAQQHPQDTLAAAGDLLRALAAPVRIAIVLQLRESNRCVHELVAALNVTQPLISQHLRVLKSAGVVAGERRGREVIYRLVDEHLAHIVTDAVVHVEETGSTRGPQ